MRISGWMRGNNSSNNKTHSGADVSLPFSQSLSPLTLSLTPMPSPLADAIVPGPPPAVTATSSANSNAAHRPAQRTNRAASSSAASSSAAAANTTLAIRSPRLPSPLLPPSVARILHPRFLSRTSLAPPPLLLLYSSRVVPPRRFSSRRTRVPNCKSNRCSCAKTSTLAAPLLSLLLATVLHQSPLFWPFRSPRFVFFVLLVRHALYNAQTRCSNEAVVVAPSFSARGFEIEFGELQLWH